MSVRPKRPGSLLLGETDGGRRAKPPVVQVLTQRDYWDTLSLEKEGEYVECLSVFCSFFVVVVLFRRTRHHMESKPLYYEPFNRTS